MDRFDEIDAKRLEESNLEKLFGFEESQEMMKRAREQLEGAIELIPEKEKAAYTEAKRKCPLLCETESDPILFLRCEDYNSWAAARRLVTYWEKRKSTFGERRAFLPMNLSGKGALTEEDMALFNNGGIVILPNDKKNRSVVFADRSKSAVSSERACFFLMQLLCKNRMSQKEGPIFLLQVNNLRGANFNRKVAETISDIILRGFPMRHPKIRVVCFPSTTQRVSYFEKNVVPLALKKMGSLFAKYAVVYTATSKEHALSQLIGDFAKENLPASLGGDLTHGYFLQWQLQHGRTQARLEDLSSLVHNTLAIYSSTEALQAPSKAVRASGVERVSCSLEILRTTDRNGHHGVAKTETNTSVSTYAGKNTTVEDSPARFPGLLQQVESAPFRTNASVNMNRWDTAQDRLKKFSEGRKGEVNFKYLNNSRVRSQAGSKGTNASKTQVTSSLSRGANVPSEAEERAKKRKMYIIYDRRKRERQRIEIEVLQDQCKQMRRKNEILKDDNQRLEGILKQAMIQVARSEKSGSQGW